MKTRRRWVNRVMRELAGEKRSRKVLDHVSVERRESSCSCFVRCCVYSAIFLSDGGIT